MSVVIQLAVLVEMHSSGISNAYRWSTY